MTHFPTPPPLPRPPPPPPASPSVPAPRPRHLPPSGILAFHISNRHVNLGPAIDLVAKSVGMQAVRISTDTTPDPGEYTSTWMLVTSSPDFFRQPQVASAARLQDPVPGLKV